MNDLSNLVFFEKLLCVLIESIPYDLRRYITPIRCLIVVHLPLHFARITGKTLKLLIIDTVRIELFRGFTVSAIKLYKITQ